MRARATGQDVCVTECARAEGPIATGGGAEGNEKMRVENKVMRAMLNHLFCTRLGKSKLLPFGGNNEVAEVHLVGVRTPTEDPLDIVMLKAIGLEDAACTHPEGMARELA